VEVRFERLNVGTPALGDLFLRPYLILIAMSKPVSPRLLAATNLNEVV
jgi:hypothetical protein